MHIGLSSPHWPPSAGANGIVSYVEQLRDHFLDSGHDVSVIAGSKMILSDDIEVPLEPFGLRDRVISRVADRLSWQFDRSSGALAPLGRKLARDVATAHAIKPFDVFEMEESFGWSAFVEKAIDVPVVTRLHGPHVIKPLRTLTDVEHSAGAARCAAEARAVRTSGLVTSPTQAVLDETCEKYGRDASRRSLVVPNPIRVRDDDVLWDAESCDPTHVLAIGRFDFWKGADTLLLAFDRLLTVRPDARLTLVGPDEGLEISPGVQVDFETFARTRLSPLARERIRFCGRLTSAEIAPLRLDASMVVCASRWESFSYVLVESMAAGCPVISTAWPASGEIIVDEECGLLTPVADPIKLAVTMERLMSDRALAARLGFAGRGHVCRRFSTGVVGEQLLACYESLTAQPAI